MGDAEREDNATLSVSVLDGIVDPRKFGSKVYLEIRLMDQIRRLTPVSVDPESGHFSYEDLDGVMFNDYTLDTIFDNFLHIVLRSWSARSDWVDAAHISVPVRTIDLVASDERVYRVFVLEPVAYEFSSDDEHKARVIINTSLHSPFRPPVESVSRILSSYASTVDLALDTVSQQTQRVVPFFSRRAALVSAVPLGVVVAACLPLAGVMCVAGLPLLLPILAIVVVVGGVGALLASTVWAFSRNGRPWVQQVVKPICEKVGKENPEVLYPVGPNPSPTRVVRSLVPTTMWPKLALSVAVDFIGCTSYAVPVLGETADVLWAPMSYLLIDAMYRESSPWAGLFGAAEEILPFTDIIPTATLAWIKEYLPRIVLRLRSSGTGSGINHDQRYQENCCSGSVYDSNDDVGAEGARYSNSATPTATAATD